MSKYKKKFQKNIEKNKNKKDKKYEDKNKILSFAKIIFGLLVLIICASIVTIAINGEYNFKDQEAEITYDEIIAGQTFNRSEETYYVAFYEFESSEDLTNVLNSVTTNDKIYKVNLKNAMNKSIVSNSSNKKATTAEELQINGTTLIKIENGRISNYIETYDQVKTYLQEL